MTYNASARLTEAECLYVNFNFEILNGCQFKCAGCFVDTEGQSSLNEDQAGQLLHLIGDLKNNSYQPWVFFVGPTDFLVAGNTVAVLSDPAHLKVYREFKRISLQTTFLNMKNAEGVAEALNRNFAGFEIEINVIIDPALVNNDKYLNTIRTNKETFRSYLQTQDVLFFGLMNVYDYGRIQKGNFVRDYDYLQARLEPLFRDTVAHYEKAGQAGAPYLDYNFSAGRSREMVKADFLAMAEKLRMTFNEAIVEESQAPYLRFSFGNLNDSLVERQFNYRLGQLFTSPYFYERFVSFHEDLRIELKEHTSREVEEFERQLQLQQYQYASQTAECQDCLFLSSCIDRGILKIMEIYGAKNCLVAKDAILTVNSLKSEKKGPTHVQT